MKLMDGCFGFLFEIVMMDVIIKNTEHFLVFELGEAFVILLYESTA